MVPSRLLLGFQASLEGVVHQVWTPYLKSQLSVDPSRAMYDSRWDLEWGGGCVSVTVTEREILWDSGPDLLI